MKDRFGRTIDYMRISITDRCNLRCRYCMPDTISPVPEEAILSYEEMETAGIVQHPEKLVSACNLLIYV